MKIAIIYATTEGQTRKIARFCADRLTDSGVSTELVTAEDTGDLDLRRLAGVILAGSVHIGRYQGALVGYARARADALEKVPSLFLSVSLAAAGDDPEDWQGLRDVVEKFTDDTGWHPARVEHVAGAFRFSDYDFFRSWAMRWIAAQKGEAVDPHKDKEYTDWSTLGAVLDDWLESLRQ